MNPPTLLAWFNGRLVPADQPLLPLSDRGVLLGDSLFETIPVRHGLPFRWPNHLARLRVGADLTGIHPPQDNPSLTRALIELLSVNHAQHGSVRLTLTRGPGPRGYSPRDAGPPNVFFTWHPAPLPPHPQPGCHLVTAPFNIPANDPLAHAKHGSRLLNILARAHAEQAGADDALLLDSHGHAAETAGANLFWFSRTTLCSPPDSAAALPGITAHLIRSIASSLGIRQARQLITRDELARCDGLFLTVSTRGVVPVCSLDQLPIPDHPNILRLAQALSEITDLECPAPIRPGNTPRS